MEDIALKWWHVRWRLGGRIISRFAIVFGKIVGLLCLIAAVLGAFFYLLQPWIFSRHLSKSDPQLKVVPIALSNKAESHPSSASIDRYGVKFLLPNKAADKTTNLQQTTLVRFPNGMLEFRPLRDEDSIVLGSVESDKDAEELLSQEMLHSQFKLLQAAMLVTPEQVKWWRFRSRQNKRAELLLFLKFVALTQYSPMHTVTVRPIYTIASGQFRGFQFGDPDNPPYDTHIDLFDDAGRHLAFNIGGLEGHGQVLTQEEINAMLASISPTSEH